MYENLKALRESKGMTQAEFGKSIGIAKSTYNNYETGVREPKSDFWISIAKKYHVTIDYLMGYSNDPSKANDNPKLPDTHLSNGVLSSTEMEHIKKYRALDKHGKDVVDSALNLEYQRIEQAAQPAPDPEPDENIIRFPMPFYLQPSSAGFGDWADSEYAEKVMLVKEPPFGAAFIIPVNGNSMEPTYPDGCKVFVRPQHEVREGQVGIFYMDGKLWIKELGDGELLSHNPDYPPQPFQEDLRCWGLVVGICDDSYFEH